MARNVATSRSTCQFCQQPLQRVDPANHTSDERRGRVTLRARSANQCCAHHLRSRPLDFQYERADVSPRFGTRCPRIGVLSTGEGR
jgi:hypothetical protein